MPKKKTMTFEESMARLEEIVKSMEEGELTLKELLSAYSEGVELSKKCDAELKRTEKAMDVLLKDDAEGVKEEPLEIEP